MEHTKVKLVRAPCYWKRMVCESGSSKWHIVRAHYVAMFNNVMSNYIVGTGLEGRNVATAR
jgi:hypothetical protein